MEFFPQTNGLIDTNIPAQTNVPFALLKSKCATIFYAVCHLFQRLGGQNCFRIWTRRFESVIRSHLLPER
eukprot:11824087-Ditylum_brightwellii.AAC.1